MRIKIEGFIGEGKSTIAWLIKNLSDHHGIECSYIDMDNVNISPDEVYRNMGEMSEQHKSISIDVIQQRRASLDDVDDLTVEEIDDFVREMTPPEASLLYEIVKQAKMHILLERMKYTFGVGIEDGDVN